LFSKYKQDKLLYKKRIRDEQYRENESYTNSLHEALLSKSGPNFWKVWKSKFENNSTKLIQVDGTVDNGLIADRFAMLNILNLIAHLLVLYAMENLKLNTTNAARATMALQL
jgi:hypothetical protein